MGSCSLLQGVFPTQGSNSGLPHCWWFLYHLSHQGSPVLCILEVFRWVAPSLWYSVIVSLGIISVLRHFYNSVLNFLWVGKQSWTSYSSDQYCVYDAFKKHFHCCSQLMNPNLWSFFCCVPCYFPPYIYMLCSSPTPAIPKYVTCYLYLFHLFYSLFIIFGCTGSSLLHAGFL